MGGRRWYTAVCVGGTGLVVVRDLSSRLSIAFRIPEYIQIAVGFSRKS